MEMSELTVGHHLHHHLYLNVIHGTHKPFRYFCQYVTSKMCVYAHVLFVDNGCKLHTDSDSSGLKG